MKKIVLFVGLVTAALSSSARADFSLDLDLGAAPGIQDTIAATSGTFSVDVVLGLSGGDALGSYEFNLDYDETEIAFVSFVNNVPSPLVQISAGSDNGSIYGLVGSGSFTPGTETAADATFTVGTFQFSILAAANDGVDLTLTGVNAFRGDNSPITASGAFGGGIVAVPEPSSIAVLGLTCVGLVMRRRRA